MCGGEGGLKILKKNPKKHLTKKKSKNGMRLRLQALRKKGGFDKHKKKTTSENVVVGFGLAVISIY